jgi:hypothetical protein
MTRMLLVVFMLGLVTMRLVAEGADAPKEKKLTELQAEKGKRLQAQMQAAEMAYRQSVAPLVEENNAWIKEICQTELGIPEDAVKKGECKVDLGRKDKDGKPAPVAYWQKTPEAKADAKK